MQNQIDTKHVGVLDGVRAIAILLIVNYHFWQQSWLWNLWDGALLRKFGIYDISANYLASTGYVFVDLMLLLTGFCLFLPYARAMYENTKLPDARRFYVRRVARIAPSYYFCIAVFAIFFVKLSDYASVNLYIHDLGSHLTFTQMLTHSAFNTKFNGVLWTLGVEAAFYIIFPIVAKCFSKKPILTYISMCGVSWLNYIFVFTKENPDYSFQVNQFPTFLCVFANGMMAALVFVYIANDLKHSKITTTFFTILTISSLYFICVMLKYNLYGNSNIKKWQIDNRYLLSLLFTVFIVGLCFSFNFIKKLFDNRLMRFIAEISFNLYIWHQFISVKLKEWKIPYWNVPDGELPQEVMGSKWQWKYTIICWVVSIGFAILTTYLIERPAAKLINKLYDKKQEAKK